MTIIDATANPVQLQQYYGYTQSNNGITRLIVGRAIAVKSGKIVLDHLKETTYVCISTGRQDGTVDHPKGTRTVSSVVCWPVDVTRLKTA